MRNGIGSCLALLALSMPVAAKAQSAAWSGFYVGLNAGAAWTHSDIGFSADDGILPFYAASFQSAVTGSGPGNASDRAFTGGGQVGYNYKVGSFVFGLEADFNSLKADTARQVTLEAPAWAGYPFTHTETVSTDWVATIRPRIGFLVQPGTLVYITGGVALSEITYRYSFDEPRDEATLDSSSSNVKAGWTIGGGGEIALNRKWSLKAEYLYADFGDVATSGMPVSPIASGRTTVFGSSADLAVQTVRAGLNYSLD